MKKLDLYIAKSFSGPFLGAFFISTIFFILQLFWVFLEEITGKGLDISDILKFTFYITILSVGNAFPLSVLVASIMTFGNLSETSESISMRAMGFSFSRISFPIGVISVAVMVIAFAFQNYIIPKTTLKLTSLRYDIISSKPAFSLSEGTFYTELDGFVILVGKKEADNKHIKNVVIYQESGTPQDYLMTSKNGVIEEGIGKTHSLRFVLDNGSYYQSPDQEVKSEDRQFVRFDFRRYVKDFPLWQFKNQTSDSLFAEGTQTKDLSALHAANEQVDAIIDRNSHVIMESYQNVFPIEASLLKKPFPNKAKRPSDVKLVDSFRAQYQPYLHSKANQQSALNSFNQWMMNTQYTIDDNQVAQKRKREIIVDGNKRIIMAFSCLVFFLLGVPLGSMVKRGGIGLPVVIAILIFATFIFSTIFGERSSKELEGPSPYWGPWLGTLVLFATGVVFFIRFSGFSFWKKAKR